MRRCRTIEDVALDIAKEMMTFDWIRRHRVFIDFVSMRDSAHCGRLICQQFSPTELLWGTKTGIPVVQAPPVIVLHDGLLIAVPAMLSRQTLITDYFTKSTRKRQMLITDYFSKRMRTT